MMEMFRRAHDHKGAAFVEVYQNCNVFNDGAFEAITAQGRTATAMLIPLVHGEPIRFGEGEQGRRARRAGPGPHRRRRRGRDGRTSSCTTRTRAEPGLAFMLSRLSTGPTEPTPIGVFRAVSRPDYGAETTRQLAAAEEHGSADLMGLLHSRPTWEV